MTDGEARPAGLTCWGCGSSVTTLPMIGCPYTCACGVTYTATVNVLELFRAHRELARELVEFKARLAALGDLRGVST